MTIHQKPVKRDEQGRFTRPRIVCDDCQMLCINGVPCHETGCPSAWKTRERACFECGFAFLPSTRWASLCDGCANPEEDEELAPCMICGKPGCEGRCEESHED